MTRTIAHYPPCPVSVQLNLLNTRRVCPVCINVYLSWLLNKGERVSYLVQCPVCLCVGVSPLCAYLHQAEQVKGLVAQCSVLFVSMCVQCVYVRQAENVGQVKGLVAQCSVLSCSPVSEHLQTVQEGSLPLCLFTTLLNTHTQANVNTLHCCNWIESITH